MGKISPCENLRETIFALNNAGTSRREIARLVGLSYRTVQAWLARRKASTRPRTEWMAKLDETQLTPLLELGLTHPEIAQRLEVSKSCVERSVRRFALQSSRTGPRAASGHHQQWEQGRTVDKHGYVLVFVPLHPRASCNGYVREHRLVLEVALNRYLQSREVVDHIDDHPHHNWPDNLRLYASNADHLRGTLTGREKTTPRSSIAGAYGNTQKLPRRPDERETLAQCPLEIREKLLRHIAIHRPTTAHRTLPRLSFLRSGAHQNPFQ